MNIHPAFVHFPIALLMLYAALEVISHITTLRTKPWVEPTKAFMVIFGTLSAMVTLSTGEAAEHAIANRSLRPLIEMHSTFAAAATWIFAVLAIVYLLRILYKQPWYTKIPQIIQKLFSLYTQIFDHDWLLTLGAILGFIAIVITGALGGAIVYGPDTDPVVRTIYHWFF